MRWYQSIRFRLTMLLLVIFIAATVSLSAISYSRTSDVVEEVVQDNVTQVIGQAQRQLDMLLGFVADVGSQIQNDQEVVNKLLVLSNPKSDAYKKEKTAGELSSLLSSYVVSNKKLESVTIATPDNLDLYSSLSVEARKRFVKGDDGKVAEPAWLGRIRNEGTLFLPASKEGYIAKSVDRPKYAMGRNLVNPLTKKTIGLLVIELSLDDIGGMMNEVALGDKGTLALVADDGTLIYSNDGQPAGERYGQAIPNLTGSDGSSTGNLYDKGPDGSKRLTLYRYSTLSHWYVIGSIPARELLSPLHSIVKASIWLTLIGVVIGGVLLGWTIRRMIGRPLSKLNELFRLGEGGDLTVRTSFASRDEIGALGDSFNSMMKQLSELVVQVGRSGEQLLHHSHALTSASVTVQSGAREAAAATEELSVNYLELSREAERSGAMIEEVSARTLEVTALAGHMTVEADKLEIVSKLGAEDMADLTAKSEKGESITKDIQAQVERLSGITGAIVTVLNSLRQMAKQTNILALNASIEASRAGPAGRGFTVIAQEIRELSNKSNDNIGEIESLTDRINEAMKGAENLVSEAMPLYRAQRQSVARTHEILLRVTDTMTDFQGRFADVTSAMEQLNGMQLMLTEVAESMTAITGQATRLSEQVMNASKEQLMASEDMGKLSHGMEELSRQLKGSLTSFSRL